MARDVKSNTTCTACTGPMNDQLLGLLMASPNSCPLNELEDGVGNDGLRLTRTATAGSKNRLLGHIELLNVVSSSSSNGGGRAGGGTNGEAHPGAGGTHATAPLYKVYKRRWFGLVQLTLMNIMVSWDVRASAALRDRCCLRHGC